MRGVAAGRACGHGAGAIDVPPGGARCEKHNSRKGSSQHRQTQPPSCASPCHFSTALYLQHVALTCHDFVQNRIYKEPNQQAESSRETITMANGFCATAFTEALGLPARRTVGPYARRKN